MQTTFASFAERVETIESAYEFMLAYAAQGRTSDEDSSSSPQIRNVLNDLSDALDGLDISIAETAQDLAIRGVSVTLATDAEHAKRSVDLSVSKSSIS